LSLLFWVAINSINIWSIFFSSLSSNNSYAFFAGLRSIAQMLAYETFLGLTFLPILFFESSWSYIELTSINSYHFNLGNFFCFFFNFILFFISVLAETNRTPFDLLEAEGELIAGYNVEYSGTLFLFFYLAEYINIICSSLIITLLFYKYNNWTFLILDCMLVNFIYYSFYLINFFYYFTFFNIKIYYILNFLIFVKKNLYLLENYGIYFVFFFNIFIIIWLRASLPRLRYDQLILMAWKDLLPVSLFLYLFYLIFILNINFFFL
jgi:NADH:ubiquinone oxidoreductase subunit H